jgi:hypothetical protein
MLQGRLSQYTSTIQKQAKQAKQASSSCELSSLIRCKQLLASRETGEASSSYSHQCSPAPYTVALKRRMQMPYCLIGAFYFFTHS